MSGAEALPWWAAIPVAILLVLGGLIGVVNATGAFNAGLVALSKKAQGNEFRSCSSPRCVR